MALYTILFGISIFMIALVLAIIKKVFFHWRQEHKSERMVRTAVNRPAVGAIITAERCIVRLRKYPRDILVYDVASRSDLSLNENVPFESQMYESRLGKDISEENPGDGNNVLMSPEHTKETRANGT